MNKHFATVLSIVSLMMCAMTTYGYDVKHIPVSSYNLRIQMSPAMCYLQPQRSNLRQCKDGYSMTIVGLRPNAIFTEDIPSQSAFYIPAAFINYIGKKDCTKSSAKLTPLQSKIISRVMPDQIVRDLSWRRYGACTNMSLQVYFRTIANLAKQLNIPKQLSSGNTYQVDRDSFINTFVKKNKGLNSTQLQLECRSENNSQSYILTELQVCYDSYGKYRACQREVKMRCPVQFEIMGLP